MLTRDGEQWTLVPKEEAAPGFLFPLQAVSKRLKSSAFKGAFYAILKSRHQGFSKNLGNRQF